MCALKMMPQCAAYVLVGVAIPTVIVPTAVAAISFVTHGVKVIIDRRRFPAIKAAKAASLAAAWTQVDAFVALDRPSDDLIEQISSMNVSEIAHLVRSRTATAQTVLRVFFIKAKAAQQASNCVVHVFAEEAVQDAIAADKLLDDAKTSENRSALAVTKPLLGVPISIKDSTNVKGSDSTCGLFGRCLQPAADDAVLVAQLRAAGAVIHVKTNIPALLMSYECDNGIFGTCRNPVNGTFTCGGSSGGEGCLIAHRGSPAGVGSDVGGSIRIPAHFCGVYGMKPSVNRVPYRGCCPEQGDEGVAPVAGPLGNSVDDLEALFRVFTAPSGIRSRIQECDIDGMHFRVPFHEEEFQYYLNQKSKLRFLVYLDDDFIQVSPACARAVQLTADALKRQGHEVEYWTPTITEDVMSAFYELFSADRCRTMAAELGSDRPDGVVGPCLQLAAFPDRFKWLLGWVMGKLVDPVFGKLLTRVKERRVDEYFTLLAARNNLRHRYAEVMAGYDAIIAPGFTTPAPVCGSTTDLSFGAVETAIYNVLDLSIVTIPVTKVDANKDEWTPERIAKAKNKGMTTLVAAGYDAKQMHGLPVGVQVIAPRMCEERALAIAKRVVKAIGNSA